MSTFGNILTLGLVGVGGYLLITQVWPMVKKQLETSLSDSGGGGYGSGPEERDIPMNIRYPIVEDRTPDILIEDRYPDYFIEDRFPDVIQYPYYPIITPPNCGPGKFWDGLKCKRADCPPGMKWDDGKCRIDCPNGWRYSDSDRMCKPRRCDDDEYFDGVRCREIPVRGDRYRDRDNKRRFNQRTRDRELNRKPRDADREMRWQGSGNNTRDRWHEDRDKEEEVKEMVRERAGLKPATPTPETDRVEEIQKKAIQSFLEVDYLI